MQVLNSQKPAFFDKTGKRAVSLIIACLKSVLRVKKGVKWLKEAKN